MSEDKKSLLMEAEKLGLPSRFAMAFVYRKNTLVYWKLFLVNLEAEVISEWEDQRYHGEPGIHCREGYFRRGVREAPQILNGRIKGFINDLGRLCVWGDSTTPIRFAPIKVEPLSWRFLCNGHATFDRAAELRWVALSRVYKHLRDNGREILFPKNRVPFLYACKDFWSIGSHSEVVVARDFDRFKSGWKTWRSGALQVFRGFSRKSTTSQNVWEQIISDLDLARSEPRFDRKASEKAVKRRAERVGFKKSVGTMLKMLAAACGLKKSMGAA